MKPTYLDAGKLAWYPDIACPVCGGDVNSWDKRCSRALGYRQIVCEGCISEEYQVTVENLRYVMENHFGLVPCPGISFFVISSFISSIAKCVNKISIPRCTVIGNNVFKKMHSRTHHLWIIARAISSNQMEIHPITRLI